MAAAPFKVSLTMHIPVLCLCAFLAEMLATIVLCPAEAGGVFGCLSLKGCSLDFSLQLFEVLQKSVHLQMRELFMSVFFEIGEASKVF